MVPNIKYVIDMDGFVVGNKFKCRELAVCDLEEHCYSWFFKVGNFHRLSEKDRKTVNFCWRRIHGLKFTNKTKRNIKVHDQEMVSVIVGSLAEAAQKEHKLIAFKGGNYEKNLLEELHYTNYINLEELGCPKVVKLPDDTVVPFYEHDPAKYNKKGDKTVIHCPMAEVIYFVRWLKNI